MDLTAECPINEGIDRLQLLPFLTDEEKLIYVCRLADNNASQPLVFTTPSEMVRAGTMLLSGALRWEDALAASTR